MNKKNIIVLLLVACNLIAQSQEATVPNVELAPAPAGTPIPTKMVLGKPEITIGATLPLKGNNSLLGTQIADGMSLYFTKVQRERNNFPLSCLLNILDDKAKPTRAFKNITELVKQTPLIMGLLGTEVMSAMSDSILHGEFLALFPIEGAATYRTPEYHNIIFFRPGYEQEIEALVQYAIKKLYKKKFGIFYETGEWGESVLNALKKTLSKYNLELVVQASYPQNTINVTQAANDIVSKGPNVIVCAGQARATQNFIRLCLNKGHLNATFLGLSTLNTLQQPLSEGRGLAGERFITSSVVPNPVTSTLPIAQEYRQTLRTYTANKQPTPFSFEGYISAALLVECLTQQTQPLTTEKLRSFIENLKHVRFKGLVLDFTLSTRTLSNNVWINTGEKKEWFLAKS